MIIKVIGLLIGILVAIAGGYYLAKEKNDPESRNIYMVVCAIGVVIAVVMLLMLIL